MAKNNLFLNIFSKLIEPALESQLEDILQDLHDSDPEGYKAAIAGGNTFVRLVQPHVTKSKSKIDDAILSGIDDALKASSSSNA